MALPVDSTPLRESSQNVDDLGSAQITSLSSPSPAGSDPNALSSSSNQPSQPPSASPGPQATSNTPAIAAPHPKRFSAVNVTKKFLSKELPAPGPSATASSLITTKSNGPPSRSPVQQPGASRSRLFATRLTPGSSAPLPNSASWSRPSSTAPNSQPSNAAQNSDKPSNPGGPFTPQNGKIIQPQLRPNSITKDRQSNSSPVWGNRKNTQNPNSSLNSSVDFPTAAEAVQEVAAKKLKHSATQETPESTPGISASQQARIDEADTFRGVHLDPNAHHWDEMEEDDDNFLGGVVEFGDGKQYMVAQTSSPPIPSSQDMSDDRPPTPGNDEPVSKEERFGNDIGRHWPHGSSTTAFQRHRSTSPALTNTSLQTPQDANRHLFNERSNRLEPYSGHQQRTSSFSQKRDLHGDADGHHGQKSIPSSRLETGPPSNNREQGRRMGRHGEGSTNERGRRLSNMGPPPPPVQRSPIDGMRQLPPHLSQQAPPFHERERRMSSRDSHRSRTSMASSSPQLGRDESWLASKRINQVTSPALSFSSNLPTTAESPIASLPPEINLDDVRKDLMHTAAERARQRRQQEEEEREAQRERARKKAAELEAKFGSTSKAAPHKDEVTSAVTEEKVNSLIAEAISSVDVSKIPAPQSPTASTFHRTPSSRGTHRQVSDTDAPHPFHSRRTSFVGEAKSNDLPTPADKVDSWRRSAPLHPPSALVTATPKEPEKLPPPSPPAFPSSVFILEEKPDEELEVVDYAELGNFVGAAGPEPQVGNIKIESSVAGPPRPVASDFFDDRPSGDTSKPAGGAWKKVAEPGTAEHSKSYEPSSSTRWTTQSSGSTSHNSFHRTQRSANSYKEAKLSTLDDTMSRIRGALHNMHEPGNARKFVSSRLEQQQSHRSSHDADFDEEQREVFDVSASEPPRSPPPAWHAYVISLGKYSEPLEPVSKKQLINSERCYPFRWDIMSFDPPVEGMNKRDLSLNDVIFRKQGFFKGKYKYRVSLPQTKHLNVPRGGPRVNLPNVSAFGKPKDATEPTSWRRQAITKTESSTDGEATAKLATTSCSPPPDSQEPSPPQKPSIPSPAPAISTTSAAKVPPPANNGMDSELGQLLRTNGDVVVPKSAAVLHGSFSNDKSQPSSPFSATSGKVESTSSDDSTDRPITPPQRHTTTWAKSPLAFTTIESPVAGQQGPDAEHIKAVWLQTPEKPHAPVSNSLEGIGDDLTALPFTIQEVKSEDGETPPPTQPAARMSFDMKRAFQQVPGGETSSSAITSRNLQPASAPPAPHPRYPLYTYSMPPPNSSPNARPAAYGPYGPVMPPPSPAMYAHPAQMPMRMAVNGQPPYPQPVWMVQGPIASPGGVMRPLPSPYSVPMIPFAPGTPVYAMPPPTMQNGPMAMNGPMAGRIPPSPIMQQQQNGPQSYASGPSQHQSMGGYAPTPVRGQRSTSGQSFQSNPGFMSNNTWRT